jgi:hypothetical protein
MRTTLEFDDDELAAARAMAQQQHRSIGEVISDLARRSLERPVPTGARNGIPLLVSPAGPLAPVTPEVVNALRDGLT